MENGNDSNVPATKQDIALLRSEVHHIYDAQVERMADSETKLLKAFCTFAESNQTRLAAT